MSEKVKTQTRNQTWFVEWEKGIDGFCRRKKLETGSF